MSKLLITQSLLSSWNYTYDCAEGYEMEAMQSFIDSLNRVPSIPNENMQNGIQFENEVYKIVAGQERKPHPKWEKGIQLVAKELDGALLQVKCSADFSIDGYDFYLYGILDGLKAGRIMDVKFLNKSFGSGDIYGKYLNSPQHPAYLFALPEAYDFTYIVSDGDEIYKEHYTRADTPYFPELVSHFIKDLERLNLLEVYLEKWKAKG